MNKGVRLWVVWCCGAVGAWPQEPATRQPQEAPAYQETAAPHVDTATAKEVPEYFKAHQQAWDEAPGGSTAAPSATPAKTSEKGWNTYIPRTLMGLCMVCGMILLGGVLFRKYGRNTPLLAGQRLGVVLGKVHLTPKASLHYVKSGGKVIVVGLTQNQLSPVAEFDAEAFESALEAEAVSPGKAANTAVSFLDQLRTQVRNETGISARGDEDLTELRGDLQRLQRYLQESARESNER